LYNVLQVTCDPGDEVIIISPYWLSYPEMVTLAGAKSVFVQTDEKKGFRAAVQDIKRAISEKTRAIVINSPSNPAGVIYSRQELSEIADICVSKGIVVISDEIYEKLVYDGREHVSIASLGREIYDTTVTVNGVSKSYAMTGWRIGYIAAPEPVAKAVSTLQSHSTSNPASISQCAAVAALNMGEAVITGMREAFEKKRDLMSSLLDGVRPITYVKPAGAFYVFCNIEKTGLKASDFASKLLDEKLVAVVPGESFGSAGHIRLSFATSEDNIKKGMERLKSWVGQ
ncbi:MAG: pyridoxal phosphate-dependent aminotransferase, partial [Candidatus Omnitrophota bacterium]